MKQALHLRQSQSMVMTQQLQLAIKLLQYSNMELAEYIGQEIEKNPLLDFDDSPETPSANDAPEKIEEKTNRLDQLTSDRVDNASETPLDTDFDNVWTPEAGEGNGYDSAHVWSDVSASSHSFDSAGDDWMDRLEGEGKSLREHLLDQITLDFPVAGDRLIAAHMLEHLDDAGYFTGDLAKISETLGCFPDRAENVLYRLQKLDPPGIFARSLKECLALQLDQRNRLDPAMEALLDHLDLLAGHDMQKLLKVCGVDREDLADMIAEIKALSPKPGLPFLHDVMQTKIPDILMVSLKDGGWGLELNSETLPRVLVNKQYYTTVLSATRAKQEKEYLSEQYQTATWLARSLDQRAQTILKVGAEITRQQDAFFRQGVKCLKPMVLKDVADAIEMHESTVSRVTTGKYIATPRGVFELKYFFSAAVPGTIGGVVFSAEAVRHQVNAFIMEEAPDDILSDDRIVDLLRAEGVDVARRTVAKYRDQLGLPPSSIRRKQKAMG